MNLLVTDIKWDTDGVPAEECGLPATVLVLDVPYNADSDDYHADIDHLEEAISEALSDCFGFCHEGFSVEPFSTQTHAGGGFYPQRLGAMPCPEL